MHEPIRKHNPNTIFLMETKVNSKRAQNIIRSWKYLNNFVEALMKASQKDYGFMDKQKQFSNG